MLWSLFAFLASLGAAAMPLLQQRIKADGFSMLFWLRLFSTLAVFPVVLMWFGLPPDPVFYAATAGASLLFAINDVIYFNAVRDHGAGVVARLLPAASIVTFFLWFAFDPGLIATYLETPLRSGAIVLTLIVAVVCAMHLKRCAVSQAALRAVWPVLGIAVLSPIIGKLIIGLAPGSSGPLAYLALQGFLIAAGSLIWQIVRRPVSRNVFTSALSIRAGALIALASVVMIASKNYALLYVDNPAYVAVVLFTAPFWISLFDALTGRKDESNRAAGLGLVACALLITALKIA